MRSSLLLAVLVGLAVAAPAQKQTSSSSALSGLVHPLITQPLDESQRVVLKGNTHPLARAQYDRGAAPPNLPMDRMLLVLKRSPEQETALRQLLDEQQDKASPNYHKWLTPDEFGKQFGVSDSDLQIVTGWLQTHGFTVARVSHGRTVIEFSGTAAQVEQTFGTPIHQYVVNGQQHWANASDPQIPAALAPVVAGVHTLHNFEKKPMHVISPTRVPIMYSASGQPQATSSSGLHALSPGDYAVIYNLNPLYNAGVRGFGTTIAIAGRSDILASDIYDFQNAFGIGFNFQMVTNGPDPGDSPGDDVESTLDVSWAGVLAPGANIWLVMSASTNTTDGIDLSRQYVVDNNLADIMSVSYGICEAWVPTTELTSISMLDEQAAAEGITQTISTGDTGSAGCDNLSENVATGPLSVNALASTPYTVAVGGTMFNDTSNPSKYWSSDTNVWTTALSYIPENVWNETCTSNCGQNAPLAAGGGGPSSFFSKPSWQSGVSGIPADGKRDVPDVSLTAALHDGYLLCFAQSCSVLQRLYLIGGTSASAPSFAGIMALVDQRENSRQGQANYVLYRLATQQQQKKTPCNGSSTSTLPVSTCVFNDVTVGNNSVPGEVGYNSTSATYKSATGYDLATGLGSVNAANLVNNWNTVTFSATTTSLTLNSGNAVNVVHGQSVPVQVTVAPQSGTGAPTGDVVLLSDLTVRPNQQSIALLSPLTSGSISTNLTSLPGGSYNVHAHYAGDGTYAPSDSSPAVAVTVTPEPSTTSLTVASNFDQNGNPIPFTSGPYGSFLYLRADVKGQSGQGIPTGQVQFFSNNNSITQQLPLNSQGNTSTPQGFYMLPAGRNSIVATYFGDLSFNMSSSLATNVTITQGPTSTTLQASPASVGQGSSVTLTANIATNSQGNPPTGSATFLSNGSAIGTAPVQGVYWSVNPQNGAIVPDSGTATFSTSSLPTGTNNITVQYTGDTNYVASASGSTPVNVVADFSLPPSLNPVTVSRGKTGTTTLTITGQTGYNSTINFSVASCSGLPFESTCSFTPASVTGSGQTTIAITTTAPTAMLMTPGSLSLWASAGGFGIAGIFLISASSRRQRWSRILALIMFAGLIGAVGCGGASSSSGPPPNPGTPTGTYTVTINAVTGPLSHSTQFTLTVNP